MRENLKYGSVRGVEQSFMVEYCDTPHIEREEKQGIQSIPKKGGLDVYSTNNNVKVDLSKLYQNIDIPETLSNLLGKWIKRVTTDEVEFEDGEKIDLKDLGYKLIKTLIWW